MLAVLLVTVAAATAIPLAAVGAVAGPCESTPKPVAPLVEYPLPISGYEGAFNGPYDGFAGGPGSYGGYMNAYNVRGLYDRRAPYYGDYAPWSPAVMPATTYAAPAPVLTKPIVYTRPIIQKPLIAAAPAMTYAAAAPAISYAATPIIKSPCGCGYGGYAGGYGYGGAYGYGYGKYF